jgi:excisionase family DNA binding protein
LNILEEGIEMPDPITEKWSSLYEIAEHLGVSKDTVYRWIINKQMPACKIGRLWKFKKSEIDEWIKNGKSEDLSV